MHAFRDDFRTRTGGWEAGGKRGDDENAFCALKTRRFRAKKKHRRSETSGDDMKRTRGGPRARTRVVNSVVVMAYIKVDDARVSRNSTVASRVRPVDPPEIGPVPARDLHGRGRAVWPAAAPVYAATGLMTL